MSKQRQLIIGFLVVWPLLTGACWGEGAKSGAFSYDPHLAGQNLPEETTKSVAPIPFDAHVTQEEVRVSTKAPISPYLEAVGGPAPTAEELRLLPDQFRSNPLERYQLGAGVNIAVEDRASLSLGYRFHQPLSLLDDSRQTPPSEREDLRIFFDLKLPFD